MRKKLPTSAYFGDGITTQQIQNHTQARQRRIANEQTGVAAQVEAPKKYRSCGEQKITVQHVTVNEGGQAVVGNISMAKGGSDDQFVER